MPKSERSLRQRAEKRARLTAHAGLATWGERLVPLGQFRSATAAAGRTLDSAAQEATRRDFLSHQPDPTTVEGPYSRIAVFGGVYNNHPALAALLDEVTSRSADAIYCLGDLGGFGPHPNKVRPLLEEGAVRVIQGNYEESLAANHQDCNCGYTDPRDNHFADVSYRYTAENTSLGFKRWMGTLPRRRRVLVGNRELLLVHGSPRRINEFLFASTTPVPFLEMLLDQEKADALCCTHTGLEWHRPLPSGRDAINVGVIGRPANDGRPVVRYCWLEEARGKLAVELVELAYDHRLLAQEMRREELPNEFIETILDGWWTTCLEILPARERARSRH
ncbi:MAG: metallophosphatase family protein [Acidobacteriota bacterium]|nr:metallophosphatase family protein [Acidobacteriota bacterium]